MEDCEAIRVSIKINIKIKIKMILYWSPLVKTGKYKYCFWTASWCLNCLVVCVCAVVCIGMCSYWTPSLEIKVDWLIDWLTDWSQWRWPLTFWVQRVLTSSVCPPWHLCHFVVWGHSDLRWTKFLIISPLSLIQDVVCARSESRSLEAFWMYHFHKNGTVGRPLNIKPPRLLRGIKTRL